MPRRFGSSDTAIVIGRPRVDLSTDATGILPVGNGGTAADDAGTARTNLGLGALATKDTVSSTDFEATDGSAVLDLPSTTKGFLPPRMTTAERDAISSPTEGLVIYNSTTQVLNFYNGSSWGAV